MPNAALVELDLLVVHRVRRVVGRDAVDGAVAQPFDHRQPVGLCAQRRVHLGRGVVLGVPHGLVREQQVVRRGLGRHPHPARLAAAHRVHGARGRDVRDVDLAARELRQQHVPLDHHGLGRARPAAQPQQRGHGPFVHRGLLGEAGLLAVVDHGQRERLRVLQRAAHDARAGDGTPVVRDRDAAGLAQVAVLGQLLAPRPARDGADRVDAHGALGARALQDRARDAGRVVDGLGVGHRADGREPARGRRPGAGRDRLLVLAARLGQVRVQVDEAGAHHATAHVDRGRALRLDPAAQRGDAPVLDAHVGGPVPTLRGIDDPAALQDQRAHSAASGAPPSRR
jgi:hypothetical protein